MVSPEQKARYNANRRAAYAADPERRRLAVLQARKWEKSPAGQTLRVRELRIAAQKRADLKRKNSSARRSRKRVNHWATVKAWNASAAGRAYYSRPEVKLAKAARVRTSHALNDLAKAGRTFDLIDCTPLQLRRHIESQFKPGMSWEQRSLWHIDHITPISFYDLTKPEEQLQAFHWSNLQPLWALENLQKGAKLN